MNNSSQDLGAFGWNWSFLGDIRLETDSEGDVTIPNSGIGTVLPQQRPGTALYETGNSTLPTEQLVGNPYNIGTQQLLTLGSASQRLFELQANGSYQGQDKDKGILSKDGDTYQLKEKNGTVIVFRVDGQLDYVEDTNGYRITAGYVNEQLISLTATDGDSFTFSYNSQGHISAITDSSGQTTTYE